MPPSFVPIRLLLLTFAGLVSHEQQLMLAYLFEGDRILREQHYFKRLRLGSPWSACLLGA